MTAERRRVASESPWAAVVNAAGAAGAAIASVYAIGSIVTSLRYEGFGLGGQEAVAVTPREVLLFAGTRFAGVRRKPLVERLLGVRIQ